MADDDTIKREDIEVEEEEQGYLEQLKSFNPCGSSGGEYSNPTAAIAISTSATALIAAGMPGIYSGDFIKGAVLVVIGVTIYFIKAYLMKKNCI